MKHFAFMVLSLCIISGCAKNYVEAPEIPEDISFNDDILPIFTSHCESCHQTDKVFPDLILSAELAYTQLLTDGINAPYVNIADPESSKLYVKIKTNMPPFDILPSYNINMILKWIQQGAKNN